jgi:hypothetical protein
LSRNFYGSEIGGDTKAALEFPLMKRLAFMVKRGEFDLKSSGVKRWKIGVFPPSAERTAFLENHSIIESR